MKSKIWIGVAALAALAFFATRANARRRGQELEVRRAPAPLELAPTPAPKSPIKKGSAPGAQAPPELIPYEAQDSSTYLQPIGSCELGSGIPGTLYLNQFGEEVCA